MEGGIRGQVADSTAEIVEFSTDRGAGQLVPKPMDQREEFFHPVAQGRDDVDCEEEEREDNGFTSGEGVIVFWGQRLDQ